MLLLASLTVLACGGGSDGQPDTPVSPSGPAQSGMLSGVVTDTVSGAPVPGATVTIEGSGALTTDGEGRWRLERRDLPDARLAATIRAAGYVGRDTFVQSRSQGRQDLAFDVIPDRAPFTMPFYRALVRNAYEEPGALEPVRRWTTNPNFYIQTHNPRTGRALSAQELDSLTNAIRQSVPQLTGGELSVGSIRTGEEARDPRLGEINVRIVYEPSEDFCGRAYVGSNPGDIELNYDRCSDACRGVSVRIPPSAVAHEVGHALGFWHVEKGIMNPYVSPICGNVQFSEAEKVHARIAYRRPNGNMDQDRDPGDYAASLTTAVTRVSCPIAAR